MHYKGRRPEYTTMSRRPGIGAKWFERYYEQVYARDEVIVNGVRTKPPAYYDRLLGEIDPDKLEEVKAKRVEGAMQHQADQTLERRMVRQRVREAKIGLLEREL